MRTPGPKVGVLLCTLAVAANSGCVAKEQYEKVRANLRKCDEHRQQLQQELQAEKDNVAALQNQLATIRDQYGGKDAEIARLQQENNQLSAALDEMKKTAQAALDRPPVEPTVIVRKLPAELHKALQEFAQKYPDMVEYDAQRGAVKWKSDLVFALGSDVVKDTAKASLQAFAKIAASPAASKFDVLVVGHTDNLRIAREETRKLHPTNWHLSAHRAIAVNNMLMDYGVSKNRAGVMGYGEYRPIAPNTSDQGRQKNRRVEIYLVDRRALGVGQANGMTWLRDGSMAFARVK
ncbi:MAG: OmpA family protein [Phycisphaerae bacterium]|nr:OmpA family protein [Phycisphaerae bacterium]